MPEPGSPLAIRYYESTAIDPESPAEVHFITFPAASTPAMDVFGAIDLLKELQIEHRPIDPDRLDQAVFDLFRSTTLGSLSEGKRQELQSSLEKPGGIEQSFGDIERSFLDFATTHADLLNFAEEVVQAAIIPFETSPLTGQSLASIAASASKGGPVVLGSVVGFLTAGNTPFLIVAVPAGIVLCGVGAGFAEWFYKNRDKILNKLFGITTDRKRSGPRRAARKVPAATAKPEPSSTAG